MNYDQKFLKFKTIQNLVNSLISSSLLRIVGYFIYHLKHNRYCEKKLK